LSSYLLPSFSEAVEMPLNAELLVCSFLAAVVLCVTGGFDRKISRVIPNIFADSRLEVQVKFN
jgi:hypothetical protein